ncbi:hypothetical protein MXL54_19655 [Enterobacteriaceae bacterium G50]|nr:hypothetical protein [Enterobacteriaceae bacterium G50]
MLDKLYFWKGGGNGSVSSGGGGSSALKLLLIILVLLGLMAAGAGGYWYYYIYIPEQERQAEQEAIVAQLQADTKSVNSFYESSLEGMSIDQTLSLFEEINKSLFPLRLAFVGNGLSYTCDDKKCDFSFDLNDGVVATSPVLVFSEKNYKASPYLPKGKQDAKSGFQFTNVAVNVEKNALLKAYKQKKPVELESCNEIVSYVTSYNSFLGSKPKNGGRIKFISFPSSTVDALEKKLGTQVYSFGMRSATWEIEIKGASTSPMDDMTDMQMILYKQPYRSAFLIRKISSTDKGIKVSGGLVCKA